MVMFNKLLVLLLFSVSLLFLTGCETSQSGKYHSKAHKKQFNQKSITKKIAYFDKKMSRLKEKGAKLYYPQETKRLEKSLAEMKRLKKSGATRTLRALMKDYHNLSCKLEEKLDKKHAKRLKKKAHKKAKMHAIDPAKQAVATYSVKAGDSLYSIARAHYGDASKWRLIYRANKALLESSDDIKIGQVLRLP